MEYLYGVRAEWDRRCWGTNRVLGIPTPQTQYSDDVHFAVIKDLTPQHTATFIRWATPADIGSMHEVAINGVQSLRTWNAEPEMPETPGWLLHPCQWRSIGAYQSGQWDSGHYHTAGVRGWVVRRPKRGTPVWKTLDKGGWAVWTMEGLTGAPQPVRDEHGPGVHDAIIAWWALTPTDARVRESFAKAFAMAEAMAKGFTVTRTGVYRTSVRMEAVTWRETKAALDRLAQSVAPG